MRKRSFGAYVREVTAIIVVAVSPVFGAALSSRVPPDGVNCRVYYESAIAMVYILSYASNWLIFGFYGGIIVTKGSVDASKKLRNATMAKDIIVTISMMTVMIVTQVGLLNSVECYRCRGTNYMCLPETTQDAVMDRLLGPAYAGYIFGALGSLLLLGLLIGGLYYDGMRVFLQLDSEVDHGDWFGRTKRWLSRGLPTIRSWV
jgi:hypothetical protein